MAGMGAVGARHSMKFAKGWKTNATGAFKGLKPREYVLMTDSNIREVVGAFRDVDSLESAAEALMSNGFDRNLLSLVASEETVQDKLGHRVRRVEELIDDPATPRISYVDRDTAAIGEGAIVSGLVYLGAMAATGAVLVSGGALLPAVAAAAAGGIGGGGLGALLASRMNAAVADKIAAEVDRGGLILWVRTDSDEADALAQQLMRDNGAHDVHAHGSGEGLSDTGDRA